jgi:PHD/YefM family antitoxin component YafN of YafNO toxin-antitoxin module
VNIIRFFFISFFLLALLGCKQNYSGDVGGESAKNTLNFGQYNAAGARLYGEQCAGCHGAEGNGTEIGTPLVACASCTGIATLTNEIALTMPIGKGTSVSDCDGQCASDVAEYIMYAFNGWSLYEASKSLEGVSVMSLEQTLRNATVQFVGRLPTAAETARVIAEGETGFTEVMNDVMAEDKFRERLNEIFNDVFLTDKYLWITNNDDEALDLLDSNDYENKAWYSVDYPSGVNDTTNANRGCANRLSNDAVAREGLELINHITRNNRPITELVTADYIMVNWYSQKVYDAVLVNINDTFATLAAEENPCVEKYNGYSNSTLRFDPDDFKPARIYQALEHDTKGIPHAGILTSAMFLNRFPTTDTNRNRHRSYKVYDIFLDTDILAIEGSRPEDSIDTTSAVPTLQNPACYTCHTVMDSVASTFQHWDERGRRIPSYTSANSWSSNDIESPGIAGKKIDISGSDVYSNMLQWLGNEIAQDPRYMRAITRHLYKGIVGQDLLPTPGDGANKADIIAFNAQRSILTRIGQAMAANNWNIKTAINGILLSPYYRAVRVDHTQVVAAGHVGSVRLLTPEMLQRKLTATLGFDWYELHENEHKKRIMFGGIDSDSVTTRITEPSGLMIAMQERMAVEMACRATAFDFSKKRSPTTNERRLFRFVSPDIQPFDNDGFPLASNIAAIKTNIQYLHSVLLSEELAFDSPEIEATYQLFIATWRLGQEMMANPDNYDPRPTTSLPGNCQAYRDRENNDNNYNRNILDSERRIRHDENYVIRSWMSVMTYLLSDYRYIFE